MLDILLNISKSKGNQTMEFSQLINYNSRNIFLEKSYTIYRVFSGPYFSCIWTEYGDLQSNCPYSVPVQENTDQKWLCIWTLFTQCWDLRKLKIRKTIELGGDKGCCPVSPPKLIFGNSGQNVRKSKYQSFLVLSNFTWFSY